MPPLIFRDLDGARQRTYFVVAYDANSVSPSPIGVAIPHRRR